MVCGVGLRVSDADWLPVLLDRVPGRLRVSRSGVVDRVFSFQAGGAQPGSAIRRFHLFWSDHTVAARGHDREPLVDAFESALRALFVKEARGYHFVHAGCVGLARTRHRRARLQPRRHVHARAGAGRSGATHLL